MVEPLPSKQATRVRFPSLAPFPRRIRFGSRWRARSVALAIQFASPFAGQTYEQAHEVREQTPKRES